MKLLFLFIHISLSPQINSSTDSVNLRVYNISKYFVKQYTVTINHVDYTFKNIEPNKYSQHKKLPFIYASNSETVTILVKDFLTSPYTITTSSASIDHIRDKKINNGSATLILSVKLHHKKPDIKTTLIQNND